MDNKIEQLSQIKSRLQQWKQSGQSTATNEALWHDIAFLIQVLDEPTPGEGGLPLNEKLALESAQRAMLESRLNNIHRLSETYFEHMTSLLEMGRSPEKTTSSQGQFKGWSDRP